jgi:phenylpyruvate tautomerase PptA (4-oxalocrotonate tautomerase family)
MPILKIQSSKKIKNREIFMHDATSLLSELLQKPAKYIMIICEDTRMYFADDPSPSLYAELKSIGLPEDRTAELSDALCRFFEDYLDIPRDRVYIEFSNAERHLLGWNGKTFLK